MRALVECTPRLSPSLGHLADVDLVVEAVPEPYVVPYLRRDPNIPRGLGPLSSSAEASRRPPKRR